MKSRTEIMSEVDAALAERDAEIERALETNTRLNRRVQAAEKAVADAQACIDKLSNGKPWCGGNLGRALLAFQNDRQGRELTRLRAVADAARKFVTPLLGTGIEFENKDADAAFVNLLDALDAKETDHEVILTQNTYGGFMCPGEWRFANENPTFIEWVCQCGHIAGCRAACIDGVSCFCCKRVLRMRVPAKRANP